MAQKFKIGDVVELKSGGPAMTLDAIHTDGEELLCKWFVGKNLKEEYFSRDALKPAKQQDKK